MKKSKLIHQVAVAFAIVFMSAVLCGAGCSNVASDSGGGSSGGSGASSTMTEAEAIAAIKALQSGGSITIKLDSSVKTISTDLKNALNNANKKVTLDLSQSGVTSIGNDAFKGCGSLTSVEIPSGVTSIGESAFWVCTSLTSVKIPSGVTSIGNNAFYECNSLTSVEIPDSVTSIGTQAFVRCKSLTSVKIPSGVTSISESAFSGCNSLTSVEIPSSVTSIGNNAFSLCDLLDKIKYTGTKNDWNTRITSFGPSWRYQDPVLAGVTCSDGKTYKFVGNTSSSADSKLGAEI